VTRRQEIPKSLGEEGLDALVAVSMENFYYSSGALILTQRMIPTRMAFVVWTASGAPTMIVCTLEEAQARTDSWIKDIRGYIEFVDSPMAVLASVLSEKGMQRGRIGLETRALASRYHAEISGLLPEATFVDGDEVFDKVRMIKSAEERDLLTRAARLTDAAIKTAFEGAHIDDTELAVTETMTRELVKRGADGLAFVVMTTGKNSRLTHPLPSSLRIQPKDVVRTDSGGNFGSYFGGYFSDIARTAVAGKADDKQRDLYKKLFEVHDLLLRNVKPGIRACDLYAMCKQGFEERGVDFRNPHIGHGIGISIHEHPMLNPQTTQELEPGMILSVEPVLMGPDGIYHIEDTVEVTDAGSRVLSDPYAWSELKTVS
jgi:Xaa-Pro aminopeptidase